MHIDFHKHPRLGALLLKWWTGLDEDRASRATLRRAASVTEIALTPAYQRLYRRLCEAGWPDETWRNDKLAAAVGLLAHVTALEDQPMPAAMSQREGDKPRVSALRFMRLLDSPDVDALFIGLRRALPLVQHRANVLTLANDVVNWGDPVKKRWAYAYDWPDKTAG